MCGKHEQHIPSADRSGRAHTWHLCGHASALGEDTSVSVFLSLTESHGKAMQRMSPWWRACSIYTARGKTLRAWGLILGHLTQPWWKPLKSTGQQKVSRRCGVCDVNASWMDGTVNRHNGRATMGTCLLDPWLLNWCIVGSNAVGLGGHLHSCAHI